MHQAGIVHRDLKDSNIMLADRGGMQRAVLMDFGLAQELSDPGSTVEEEPTIPATVLGTPEYMAPEQFEGEVATPASDVYAVGIILYELVTGKHPFASSNPLGAAVLRGKRLAPASSVTHDVPRRWDVAIRTCLEYEARERYQSASELARVLTGNTFGVGVLQKRWAGSLLAAAGSALIAALTWFVPALLKEVKDF
jgi:serine/threonine-protein kinase